MTTTGRRLYVYYRVPAAEAAEVAARVRAMQVALCDAHPGLRAELLRRPPLAGADVTLMETYAAATGVAAALDAAIASAAAALPGSAGRVARHVEVFEDVH